VDAGARAGRVRLGVAQPIAEARGPAASMRRDALFRRALAGADMFAFLGAFALTIVLSSQPLRFTPALLLGLPLVVLGAKVFGLYDRDEMLLRKTTLDEAPKLLQVATLCALLGWFSGNVVLGSTLARRDGLLLWLALALLLVLTRVVARKLALRLAPPERCLFIGDRDTGAAIVSRLTDHCGMRAEVVARVELDEAGPWSADAGTSHKLEEIRDLAKALDVHRAIVAPRSADAGEILDLVRTLKAVGLRVSMLPRLLEVVGSAVEFDDLHGVTLMGLRRFELSRSSALAKRALDLLGASLGLLAIAPLMATIALAIKLDSRGPVLFRQLRVGKHGSTFEVFKFRTMVANAEELKDALRECNEAQDGLFKIADDPRITRVGRLLRRSALDELPQLLNVLKGEMSLVGPRPLVVEEDQRVVGWHRRRLELVPGMTGHWQILGPARVPLREMVAIDYLYIANWSLWTDVKIMLRTVPHVIGRRGL
jgi:exopolysaccharide biosynthesis polyprenyl glycosylphosphotransferase